MSEPTIEEIEAKLNDNWVLSYDEAKALLARCVGLTAERTQQAQTIAEQAKQIEDLKAEHQSSWAGSVEQLFADLKAARQRIEELERDRDRRDALHQLFENTRESWRDRNPDGKTRLDFLNVWLDQERTINAQLRATITQQNHTIKSMGEQASVWKRYYALTCPPSPTQASGEIAR